MKTKTSYLTRIQAFLFVLFLLLTFYFNRFAVDDYHFIGELKTSTFKAIYHHLYFDWHGRWTSNFLLVSFLKLNQFPSFLMLYNLFSIGLLYLGITRLLNSFNSFYKLHFKRNTILVYGIIFLSILFFCTISANDVWLWYTSSVVYLWSTIAFFWGTNTFFKLHKKLTDYIVLGVSAVYIGGSNEPLTIFIILILLLLLIKKQEKISSSIGLIFILISFLINYLSPGTLHRDEITPSLSFIDLILYTGYSSLKFLFLSIGSTFIPALFLAFPFYLLGKKIKTPLNDHFNPRKELLKSVALIAGIVIFNQLIVVYALGGLSPDRSGITSSISIAIIGVRYLFLLGNNHHKHVKNPTYLLVVNVIGLFVLTVYSAQTHYNYAKAVDERIAFITNNDTGIIYVKPLPPSGYIYSAEITIDPTNFKNQHLKNGLGLKNDVVLKK